MGVVTSRDEGRDVAEAEAESCLHLALGTLFRFPMPFWKIIQAEFAFDSKRGLMAKATFRIDMY